jgi:hypothetical protein
MIPHLQGGYDTTLAGDERPSGSRGRAQRRVEAGAMPPLQRFCPPLGVPRVAPHDRYGKILLNN